MAVLKWTETSLPFVLVFHFIAAAASSESPLFVVRDGGEITLPCGNDPTTPHQCEQISWLWANSSKTTYLLKCGQTTSNRLRLSENCSLVIKNVAVEDAAQYTCRRCADHHDYSNSYVSVVKITVTEHKDTDNVTLTCSVLTSDCRHTPTWLYEGQNIDETEEAAQHMKTSQSGCESSVTFPTSFLQQKTNDLQLFSCKVTDESKKEALFTFSGEEATGGDSKGPSVDFLTPERWWWYVSAALGFIVLLTIALALIRWKTAKGSKTPADTKTSPADCGPETSQDMRKEGDATVPVATDQERSRDCEVYSNTEIYSTVAYASIIYNKKASKTPAMVRNDEDTVTYSTVKASSFPACASDDRSTLHQAINKSGK